MAASKGFPVEKDGSENKVVIGVIVETGLCRIDGGGNGLHYFQVGGPNSHPDKENENGERQISQDFREGRLERGNIFGGLSRLKHVRL